MLESLKTAFWSDPVDIPSSEPVTIDLPPAAEPVILDLPLSTSTELAEDKAIEAKKDLLLPVVYKRRIPDWNENDTLSSQQSEPSYKRPRLSKSEVEPIIKKAKIDMWTTKITILRLMRTTQYDEEKLLSLISNTTSQLVSKEQSNHLINYFIPVAKETRRWNIVEALNKMV